MDGIIFAHIGVKVMATDAWLVNVSIYWNMEMRKYSQHGAAFVYFICHIFYDWHRNSNFVGFREIFIGRKNCDE